MTDNQKYLLHCSGIFSLIGWLRDVQLSGVECAYFEDTFTIHPIIARRFGIGFAKGKYTSNQAFLAIQPNEHKWMSLIRWDTLYIRKNDNHLYFVSKTVPGDQELYPDIPSFVLIIPIDSSEKMELFQDLVKLEAREVTFDEFKQMHVNFSSKLFSIKVKYLEENEPLPERSKGAFNSFDVILKKEAYAMSTESNFQFIGDEKSNTSAWEKYQRDLEAVRKKWL